MPGGAKPGEGVVTLSLIDWNLPIAADFDAWDFKDLSCRSIVHIRPISLNVTMPAIVHFSEHGLELVHRRIAHLVVSACRCTSAVRVQTTVG